MSPPAGSRSRWSLSLLSNASLVIVFLLFDYTKIGEIDLYEHFLRSERSRTLRLAKLRDHFYERCHGGLWLAKLDVVTALVSKHLLAMG
jgi:hypothetical protein